MLHLFYLLTDLESHDVLGTSSLLPMPTKLVCQFKTHRRLKEKRGSGSGGDGGDGLGRDGGKGGGVFEGRAVTC